VGNERVFYGWYMVGASCAMQFVQSTLLLQSFGAYFAVLRDDALVQDRALGRRGRCANSRPRSSAAARWLIDRFGPQWVIRAGVVIFGTGFILLSYVIRCSLSTARSSSPRLRQPVRLLSAQTSRLIHWFERHRARAIASTRLVRARRPRAARGRLGARYLGLARHPRSLRIIIIAVCLPLSFVIGTGPRTSRSDGRIGSRSRIQFGS